MKKNKISRRKIITISSIVIAISAIIFVSLFFVFNSINKKPTNDRVLVDYKSYNGDQAYISKSNVPSSENYKSISSIKDSDVSSATADFDYSSNILTISTAEELYRFSYLCSLNTKFLDYNYELLCNIDFDDYKVNDFIPIGWKNDAPFTGSFEGNGYEIKNLEMINITSANVNTYSNMKYFAMFSSVASNSKVLNFGLVDPIITIAAISEEIVNNGGVSYVVGSNAGIVENVFVKCLSTTLLDECGITAAGGYRIAGLCVNNSGTIKNSYLATNSLYNYTLTDVIEFADIALNNSGTIENCYFYNTSIDSTSTQTTNGAYNLIYVSDLGGMTKSGTTYYGTMVKSIDDLNSTFKELGWTIKTSLTDDKNEISDYYSNETPIHRGFKNTAVFSDGVYTIKITDVADFLFMFEAMNENNYFASNAIIYELISDLNLSGIPAKAYSYKSGFGASFVGDEKNDGSVTFINGSKNNYTIYNVDIANPERKHTVSGVDAYGLFPYLIGSVSKINIVTNVNLSTVEESNNVKAIGAVCGYSEGGIIDNVNVQFNVTLDSTTNIGEYYLGGVAGILGGEGGISNSTTTGSFELAKNTNYTSNTSYMGGIAVGGVVGYIEDSLGYVDTCLNNINITTGLGSSNAIYAVGGVIGAGYTTSKGDKKSQQLENLGTITIADVTSSGTGTTYDETVYSVLYAAGVIGRYLGQTEQIQMLVNQGNVLLYGSSDNKLTMLAGVMNADVKSQLVNNTNISPSQFKNKNGNTLFYASSLTNRADVQVLTTTNNLVYTSVLNIVSSNGIKSNISNIYNLNNNNVYGNSNKRSIKKLNDFDIDLSNAETYAACLNSIGSTEVNNVEVDTIYNLRNINYTNTKEITSGNTLKYSAVALGDNISIKSGKNEGNITFLKAKTSGTTTTTFPNITASIISVGIIDNVGANSTLYDIYNGGNMTLDSDVTITGNVYFSGICYSNNHKYTQIELNKFNPLSDSYDSTAVGAIDNVINKGDILVTNSVAYSNISFNPVPVFNEISSNKYGNTVVAEDYRIVNRPSNTIKGNLNVSGIVFLNASVINNTFNLGNVSGINYVIDTKSKNDYEINACGFSVYNIGNQSYILNSANNGIIKAIDLYGKEKNAYITTGDYSLDEDSLYLDSKNINASGISIRNDRTINNDGSISDYSGGNAHAQQIISFTINYGSVFAYSNGSNIISSEMEPSCKAAGILTMGLCNVINAVNYGNIYGSESAAGIFGVVYFSKFDSDVSNSNKVNISNSINYGNVYQLDKGQNAFRYEDSFRPNYNNLIDFNDENINTFTKSETVYTSLSGNISDTTRWGIVSNCNTNKNEGKAIFARINIVSPTAREYWTGSIFSLVNFDDKENAKNVNIRYLISFNDQIPIEGNESGYSAASTSDEVKNNVKYMYSSYHTIESGVDVFSKYMGNNITYSPLTTTTETIDGKVYIGIFNKKFDFRRAIEGDSEVLNNNIASDKLLSNYFQFVVYNKINDYLLDKIGWRSMAYSNAATLFATDLSNVKIYYDTFMKLNDDQYKTDVDSSLNVGTWVVNSEAKLLKELVEKYTNEKNNDELLKLIEYIFSDNNMYSLIVNNDFRADIITYLVEENKLEDIFNSDLIEFTNGYAKVLASTLSDNTSNDVYQNLYENLNNYIGNVEGTTKKDLLLAYASYLSTTDGSSFFNDTSKYARYELLKNVFVSIDDEKFYSTLYDVFSSANQTIINNSNENVSLYSAYSSLTDDNKIELFRNIILNNSPSVIDNYLNAFANDINLFAELNNKYSDYSISSFDDILSNDGSISIKSDTPSVTDKITIDNRVNLWNKLRKTETFKNYFSSLMENVTFIEHATEHKNTWMSNTGEEIGPSGKSGVYANYSAINVNNISSSTIFFGPYKNGNGDLLTIGTGTGENKIYPDNDKIANISSSNYSLDDEVTSTNKFYLSLMMTTDEQLINEFSSGDNPIINTAKKFIYDYGGSKGKNQISGYSIINKAPRDIGSTYLLENQTFDFSGTSITTGKEAWIGQFSYSSDSTPPSTATSDVTIYDGNVTITKNITYTVWKNLIENYAIKYYFAIPTTNLHETQMSGLYMKQAPWNSIKVNYFITATNVYTTHYIDYSVDDLLSVDGVCSIESNNSTEYERRIINTIFEKYLLNDTNKENFEKIVKQSLFESLKTINDKNNIEFIDTIISKAIGTTITIGSGTTKESYDVLEYLRYDSTNTVKEYLNTLVNSNKKELIINAAATNKDVFCELMFLLFDETLTSGADDSWEPGGSGYGSSINLKDLYNTYTNTGIVKGKAFPMKHVDTTEISPSQSSYSIDGKSIDTAITQQAQPDNIGYYVGSGHKFYSKSRNNFDMTSFYEAGSTSDYSGDKKITMTEELNKILEYFDSISKDNLYSIRFNENFDLNNNLVIESGIVGDYKNKQIVVPQRCLWVAPREPGKLKFVVSNNTESGTGNFLLVKIKRKTAKDYSTYWDSIQYETLINTNGTPIKSGRLYYFESEITQEDVDAGYELALIKGNDGCFLHYIDMGTEGGEESIKASQTNYIQKQFEQYSDNALNYLIPYLTPLRGGVGDDKDSDGNYKIYAPATVDYFNDTITNKKYYTRTGTGTSADPYKFIEVTDQSGITKDNVTKYYVDTGKTISDYQKQVFNNEFIKLLGKYSNEIIVSAIKKYIDDESISDNDKKELLDGLVDRCVDNSYLIFNAIIIDYETIENATGNKTSTLSDEFKKWLVSGYLATDYYHHLNLNLSLGDTILAKELSDISNKETDYVTNSGNCEYIDENGNIIPEYFENFKLAIGLNYVDDGYGIFALASGKGIQNGTFIPDNLDLSSMDPYYNILAKDESGNATSEGNSIISLTDDVKNTSWRDLTGKSTDTNYDVSKEDSVNYAFKTEMKQLKKSISTTIFELDLSYSKDVILYAGTNEITSNTITYYLPKTYIEILKENSSVAINYRIADSASLLTNNSNDVSINFNGVEGPDSNGIYILSNAVTVTAEDTSVVQNYDIVLVPTSVDFEITGYTTDYTDNTKLNYDGGKVTLNIKTTNMPNGFNFSKYLTITNNDTNCDQWEIDNATINNGVVENGNCRLVIDVKSSMPGGILTFTLSAFETSSSQEIEKIQNTEAIIKNFEYEGEDRVGEFAEVGEGTDLHYELTSTILFGRAYNYSELTNYSSSDFYLYNFAYSDNAEVNISAVKELDDGLMKYTITYTITSENGETKNIYKHILNEKAFDVDSIFANVYKDGISQDDSDLYKNSFADGNAQLNNNDKSSLKYREGINFIALSFNRGVSPEYRIKYNLANFYTLDGVDYSYSVNDNAQNTSITESYRGLTVSVSDEFAPGVYKYEYTYSRSGNWSDGEYTREYTFPSIYVVKLLSTDALLNRLTFIDSSIMLGNTATVMVPTKSIVVASPATDEYTYSDLFKLENRDIEIKGRNISYNNNSNAINISDYYAIGTVSDSDLSYYCPTFGIEEHAQIYQYTTLNKLKNYGENQTDSDSKILSDHSSRLLYVPFVSNKEIYVFLVLIDDNTGKWKAVYDTDFNGDTDDKYKNSIYQYTNAFSTLEATQSDAAKFTYNGKEYTVAESCGKVNENQSLYMDYIGNPREDHFWFVSYMVFSESALNGDFSEGNVRYYHISIIDATNTVYFDVVLYAPESLNLESLYMTISENIYNAVGDKSSAQISGYLVRTDEKNASGYIKYELKIKLQTLPKGYFYFYIDLPQGYKVKVRTDMANQLDTATTPGSNEGGSFLPFTSIVPKTIKLEFIVDQGDNAGNGSWGITTTDIISVKATYDGYYDKSGNLYDKDGNLITSSSN